VRSAHARRTFRVIVWDLHPDVDEPPAVAGRKPKPLNDEVVEPFIYINLESVGKVQQVSLEDSAVHGIPLIDRGVSRKLP
jgi:hypothetical protein